MVLHIGSSDSLINPAFLNSTSKPTSPTFKLDSLPFKEMNLSVPVKSRISTNPFISLNSDIEDIDKAIGSVVDLEA